MLYRESTSRRDRRYLDALRSGHSAAWIARRYKIDLKTVYRGIERARLAERPVGPPLRCPTLVLALGASCKAMRLLTCKDVHPCRRCRAKGCAACENTGVGTIPKGSAICCAVCHVSGKDGHPALRVHPSDPRPERRVEPEKRKPTRKERRRKVAVEHLEPSAN